MEPSHESALLLLLLHTDNLAGDSLMDAARHEQLFASMLRPVASINDLMQLAANFRGYGSMAAFQWSTSPSWTESVLGGGLVGLSNLNFGLDWCILILILILKELPPAITAT